MGGLDAGNAVVPSNSKFRFVRQFGRERHIKMLDGIVDQVCPHNSMALCSDIPCKPLLHRPRILQSIQIGRPPAT